MMLAGVPGPSPHPTPTHEPPHPQLSSRLTRMLLGEARHPATPYLWSLVWVAGATVVSFLLFPLVDLANVVMVYLLAVVLAAVTLGRGPAIVATVIGVATFVYFFVPHYYSFVLSDLRYLPTLIIMLCVALIVSALTSRLRAEALATQARELRSRALYLLSRGLAAAESRDAVAEVVREHTRSIFDSRCHLLELTAGELQPCPSTDEQARPVAEDLASASRAVQERCTIATDNSLFMPMVVANEAVGLVHYRGLRQEHLASPPHMQLLEAFANNAAIALHRLVVGDEARASQRSIDRERLRNVMLSSLSHDFRTPLASITGAITTIIDGGSKLDRATNMDLMQSIRQDAESLERQVRNMLDLTRLESGQLQIQREWHPMEEVVGGAMTLVESQVAGRRIDIDVAASLPLVAIDALLIERLLVNLLENAVRYTPPGSPIEVVVTQNGSNLRIDVADQGPGIPADQRERVFDKFFRLPGSRRTGGSGLGLAICRAIVQLHEGTIQVAERPGGGSLFRASIPLGDGQPSEPPPMTEGAHR
jgi:two-component system, OmpR family, sensor histidine kinase KdpD